MAAAAVSPVKGHRPVLESNHQFNEAPRSFRMHGPVISSEARNPGQKTKISQSLPLTSFEPRSFEKTRVRYARPRSRGSKGRTHAMKQTLLRRKFGKPASPLRNTRTAQTRPRPFSLLLPFNGTGRFRRDVVHHTVDAAHFINNAIGNNREYIMGHGIPVCGHAIGRVHRA